MFRIASLSDALNVSVDDYVLLCEFLELNYTLAITPESIYTLNSALKSIRKSGFSLNEIFDILGYRPDKKSPWHPQSGKEAEFISRLQVEASKFEFGNENWESGVKSVLLTGLSLETGLPEEMAEYLLSGILKPVSELYPGQSTGNALQEWIDTLRGGWIADFYESSTSTDPVGSIIVDYVNMTSPDFDESLIPSEIKYGKWSTRIVVSSDGEYEFEIPDDEHVQILLEGETLGEDSFLLQKNSIYNVMVIWDSDVISKPSFDIKWRKKGESDYKLLGRDTAIFTSSTTFPLL